MECIIISGLKFRHFEKGPTQPEHLRTAARAGTTARQLSIGYTMVQPRELNHTGGLFRERTHRGTGPASECECLGSEGRRFDAISRINENELDYGVIYGYMHACEGDMPEKAIVIAGQSTFQANGLRSLRKSGACQGRTNMAKVQGRT